MDSFKVDLNPLEKKSKWSPYYYIIMGIIYISLGVLNYFSFKYSIFHGLIWVFGGILFLIAGYYQTNFSSKYFIELNDHSVHFRNSIKNTTRIDWTKINLIHLKPISIEFILKDNSKESLSFGNVGYKNVLDIKEKMADFATSKGISIS